MGKVSLEQCDLPSATRDQVLLATQATLISSGTELAYLYGKTAWQRLGLVRLPHYPGYSNVARMADRVPSKSNHQFFTFSAHQKYCQSSERDLIQVGAAFTTETATLAAIGGVAVNAIDRARPRENCHLVVIGLGLIGQLVCRIARSTGVGTITAIDHHADRTALAASHGVDAVGNDEADVIGQVATVTSSKGAHIVIETTGSPEGLDLAFRTAAVHGLIVIVGGIHQPIELDLFSSFQSKDLTLASATNAVSPVAKAFFTRSGSFGVGDAGMAGTESKAIQNTRRFMSLVDSGVLNLEGLITHILPYSRAAEAYALVAGPRRKGLGVVLDWGNEEGR